MSTLGPQLIGQTEKALKVILESILRGRLTESEWIALRLAEQGVLEQNAMSHEVVDRLTQSGLLCDGQLTRTGQELVSGVQDEIGSATSALSAGVSPQDSETAARVLTHVLEQAQRIYADRCAEAK